MGKPRPADPIGLPPLFPVQACEPQAGFAQATEDAPYEVLPETNK
jgi:hypothetical protein